MLKIDFGTSAIAVIHPMKISNFPSNISSPLTLKKSVFEIHFCHPHFPHFPRIFSECGFRAISTVKNSWQFSTQFSIPASYQCWSFNSEFLHFCISNHAAENALGSLLVFRHTRWNRNAISFRWVRFEDKWHNCTLRVLICAWEEHHSTFADCHDKTGCSFVIYIMHFI